ncbi:hypothetical protein APY04_1861 [Hyphomicrobium sulfonivorans]|uniref:Uncharacterized protein n=1 Tax=Hyphomicrobium sulfonivorans TaxID=121290 RepID=A0A109BG36_HYPSL|nr:hypothetical protein APY04_1861 [Hyphomicrobium sulfonivorans]
MAALAVFGARKNCITVRGKMIRSKTSLRGAINVAVQKT